MNVQICSSLLHFKNMAIYQASCYFNVTLAFKHCSWCNACMLRVKPYTFKVIYLRDKTPLCVWRRDEYNRGSHTLHGSITALREMETFHVHSLPPPSIRRKSSKESWVTRPPGDSSCAHTRYKLRPSPPPPRAAAQLLTVVASGRSPPGPSWRRRGRDPGRPRARGRPGGAPSRFQDLPGPGVQGPRGRSPAPRTTLLQSLARSPAPAPD